METALGAALANCPRARPAIAPDIWPEGALMSADRPKPRHAFVLAKATLICASWSTKILDPPQPPQKHALLFGDNGSNSDADQTESIKMGTPNTKSVPEILGHYRCCRLSNIKSTPKADPLHARGACNLATDRALPWPFAAGISACRQPSVQECSTPAKGLRKVRAGIN